MTISDVGDLQILVARLAVLREVVDLMIGPSAPPSGAGFANCSGNRLSARR
jgi:hypothetical protein